MRTIISRMIVLFFVCVLSGPITAVEETPSSASHSQHLNPVFTFEDPAEKRAYTYVSEYKRLPVYNFGLGKRRIDTNDDKRAHPYSFGLGKRTRQYNFGLGKRNDNQDYYPVKIDYSLEDYDNYHSRENGMDELREDKRSNRQYSFGLGKRAWSIAGKKPSDVTGQRILFGVGKMIAEDDDSSQ